MVRIYDGEHGHCICLEQGAETKGMITTWEQTGRNNGLARHIYYVEGRGRKDVCWSRHSGFNYCPARRDWLKRWRVLIGNFVLDDIKGMREEEKTLHTCKLSRQERDDRKLENGE